VTAHRPKERSPARRVRDAAIGAGLASLVALAATVGGACGSTSGTPGSGASGAQDGGWPDGTGVGVGASSSSGGSSSGSTSSGGSSGDDGGASSGSSSGGLSPGGDGGGPPDGGATAMRDGSSDGAAPPCVGSTYNGDLAIYTAADLAAAQAYVCVNGSLLLYYQSPTPVSFPALRGVTGDILDSSDSSTPSLSFPMLVSAGSLTLTQDTALATVSAPLLTTLSATTGLSIHDDPALATLDLGSLATTAGSISIVNVSMLTIFSVPHLQSVGGIDIRNDTALTQLDLSGVTQALALDVQGNDKLGRFDMPLVTGLDAIAITTVKGAALTAVTLSSLTTAQHIDIEGAVLAQIDLHALQTTNSLLVSGGPGLTSLDLPALTSSSLDVFAANLTSLNVPNLTRATDFNLSVMNGPLDVSAPKLTDASGGVSGYGIIFDYPGVRSLSAPVLAKVLSIRVGGSSLTTLSLPQLVSADDLTVEYSSTLQSITLPLLTTLTGTSRIDNDTVLATLSLPSLTSGGLSLVNNPVLASFDVHQLKNGSLQVQMMPVTTFSAPALTTGSLDFTSDSALTSLSFPALTDAAANGIIISGAPMLTSVTTPLLTASGQLSVSGTGLTNLGAFAGLGGALQLDLRVRSNPALTDVTALDGIKSVGGAFDFEDNTSLPTAKVTALRDLIGVANIHGTITISGNAP
jgi:hypothetical protein